MLTERERNLLSTAFNLLLLAAAGIASTLMHAHWTPLRQGFFCGDESINRPYHSDTVPTFILYIMGAAPIIVIFLVEGWIYYRQMKYTEKYYFIPSTILHHHQSTNFRFLSGTNLLRRRNRTTAATMAAFRPYWRT